MSSTEIPSTKQMLRVQDISTDGYCLTAIPEDAEDELDLYVIYGINSPTYSCMGMQVNDYRQTVYQGDSEETLLERDLPSHDSVQRELENSGLSVDEDGIFHRLGSTMWSMFS